jgi:hypothetical protein
VTTAATAMDPRIRARIADFLADLDRDPVAADVLGVVVSGSAARGEEVWRGGELLSDIDLMVLTLRTNPRLITAIDAVIGRHRQAGIDGGQTPLGPLARYLTFAFYEARSTGQVVHGDVDLARLIPPIEPSTLPVWEGFRVLANRLAEHVKYARGLIPADRVVAKSYEALAEAYLVAEGRYRPSYAGRLAELEHRAPHAPAEVVAGMLAVLRDRLGGAAAGRAPDGTRPDVAAARRHLIDGLGRVGAVVTGRSGPAAAQLRALAATNPHWQHRLYWAALLARQGRLTELRLAPDPILRVWARTLALVTGPATDADPDRLLADWRSCPQLLVRRSTR